MKRYLNIAGLAASIVAIAPAHAATVTSIRIENAMPTWLQVAELQAFASGTNVALATAGATATGSGDYVPATTPSVAIDGNTGGDYPNIYHSDDPSAGEFLLVTFAQAFDVTTLNIFGRTDGASFRDVYTYTLFNGQTSVGTGTLDARGADHFATASFAPASAGPVPEPATWAMMIVGFGLVGGAMRGRRRSVPSFA